MAPASDAGGSRAAAGLLAGRAGLLRDARRVARGVRSGAGRRGGIHRGDRAATAEDTAHGQCAVVRGDQLRDAGRRGRGQHPAGRRRRGAAGTARPVGYGAGALPAGGAARAGSGGVAGRGGVAAARRSGLAEGPDQPGPVPEQRAGGPAGGAARAGARDVPIPRCRRFRFRRTFFPPWNPFPTPTLPTIHDDTDAPRRRRPQRLRRPPRQRRPPTTTTSTSTTVDEPLRRRRRSPPAEARSRSPSRRRNPLTSHLLLRPSLHCAGGACPCSGRARAAPWRPHLWRLLPHRHRLLRPRRRLRSRLLLSRGARTCSGRSGSCSGGACDPAPVAPEAPARCSGGRRAAGTRAIAESSSAKIVACGGKPSARKTIAVGAVVLALVTACSRGDAQQTAATDKHRRRRRFPLQRLRLHPPADVAARCSAQPATSTKSPADQRCDRGE